MNLVLDTSVLIDIERGVEKTRQGVLSLRKGDEYKLAITSISYTEAFHGYIKIGRKEGEIEALLENFFLLNTTKTSSIWAAKIRSDLEKTGKVIPTADIIIASIAIDTDSVFVTKDKHFEHIKHLKTVFL